MTDQENVSNETVLVDIKGQLEGIHQMLKTIRFVVLFWTILGVILLGLTLVNMIFVIVSQVPRLF